MTKKMAFALFLSACLGFMCILKADTKTKINKLISDKVSKESNGFFAGVSLGSIFKTIDQNFWSRGLGYSDPTSYFDKALAYGALAGYKHFFDDKLGFRTYITLGGEGAGITGANFLGVINGDILYNFYDEKLASGDKLRLGGFAGVGLGYRRDATSVVYQESGYGGAIPNKFDFRINFGVRGTLNEKHSFEVYGAIGLKSYTENFEIGYYEPGTIGNPAPVYVINSSIEQTSWYPFEIGVRYTYNFDTNLDHIFKKKNKKS